MEVAAQGGDKLAIGLGVVGAAMGAVALATQYYAEQLAAVEEANAKAAQAATEAVARTKALKDIEEELAIQTAIATRVGAVTGIKKAYTLMPDAIPDGPVAHVIWDGMDTIIDSAFMEVEHQFTVEVFIPSQSPAYSQQQLYPLATAIHTKLYAEHSLGGVVTDASVLRVDPLDTVEINGRGYDRLPMRLRVRDAAHVTVGA